VRGWDTAMVMTETHSGCHCYDRTLVVSEAHPGFQGNGIVWCVGVGVCDVTMGPVTTSTLHQPLI